MKMNLSYLIKSLQNDKNEIFYNKIDKYIKKNIGHKLITFTAIDKSKKYVERIYTNNSKVYPLLGRKPIPNNNWSKILNKNSKNYFIGKNKKEIKKIFFDHETIFSLGCGSIINLLILFQGKPIGTVNILNKENHYSVKDIKKIDFLCVYLIPFFIKHQSIMKKKV